MAEMRDTDRPTAKQVPPPAADHGEERERPTPKDGLVPRRPGRAMVAAEPDRMLKEARNVEFPVGVRGYQRTAVDRYVERVTRLVTELESYSSPESAVKHAADEESHEHLAILHHAHQLA